MSAGELTVPGRQLRRMRRRVAPDAADDLLSFDALRNGPIAIAGRRAARLLAAGGRACLRRRDAGAFEDARAFDVAATAGLP